MPDDEKPVISIQFTEAHLVYRAPGLTHSEVWYIYATMSGRLCYLQHTDPDGMLIDEHKRAGEIFKKMRDLLSYMEAAEVSEIQCCAEGKPKEILKPCDLSRASPQERPQ